MVCECMRVIGAHTNWLLGFGTQIVNYCVKIVCVCAFNIQQCGGHIQQSEQNKSH